MSRLTRWKDGAYNGDTNMEMKFNLDSCTSLTISDREIADPRQGADSAPGEGLVSVQVVHVPFSMGRDATNAEPDFVQNLRFRPSEARTIASALMTAAQAAR